VAVRGFILHPTYRIEAGRPVVHLFGRLESGEAFLVRDTRLVPYFFIRAADAASARSVGATRQCAVGLETMRGEPVVRIEVPAPPDTPPLRDALLARGLPVYEADVRFAIRYLIDRGIRGSLEIEGPVASSSERTPGAMRLFEDPDLRPADWEPEEGSLRVLSIDIETDPRGERVFSAALSGGGVDEVLLALPERDVAGAMGDAETSARVVPCGDERSLLVRLFGRLREIDCDVLTGWNVVDFDLDVLASASRRLKVPFEAGRIPGAARVIRDTSFWGRSRAEIAGRVVLDGIDLMKGAFMKLEDYRLETAAREILGAGKVVLEPGGAGPSGRARAEAIERAFRKDLPRFVAYNLADARLVIAILKQARLIDLAVRRSRLTGMPLDRVGASIASFDFLYLHELRRRGFVAPTVGAEGGEGEPTAGGAVLEPQPGLYDNVLAFDYKSLYPSLIRTFNIDPLGFVPDAGSEGGEDLIRAPNGARFRRDPGILPGLLTRLFPQREEAKRRGDALSAHAIKILMNSFYGVLATPACRFYSSPVANAITHFGQWVLHWTRDRVQAWGHRVLYGDTDSLFVASGLEGEDSEEGATRLGAAVCGRINDELRDHVRRTWGVESHLHLEFQTFYLKFFIPSVRRGGAGARKRYAGLARRGAPGGREEMVFVGMEVVRRDWTELSKMYQRGLFDRLFRDQGKDAVAEYTRGFVRTLKEGAHDALLIYRKALRKGLEGYTATTPPHVKAARKMEQPSRGLIEYVMTSAGPEPAATRAAPIDYRHYIDKQIRPIAEQVFPHLGLSFDEVLGEAGQMKLF
jgi:DNA polymerase II